MLPVCWRMACAFFVCALITGSSGPSVLSSRRARRNAREYLRAQVVSRQQAIADNDARYTQELTNSHQELARLERDVAAGRRRQVKSRFVCPGVSDSGTAARLDDAARARFDDAARRDYFTLRSRIDSRQINGLQDYVRRVCLSQEEK
uniref:Probable endopeptidase n=1 Tax=Phage GMSE-1 TaxID=148339 RepID=Q9B032_9VIRU|nr:probable endopeptidase [Phage GMSE-1]